MKTLGILDWTAHPMLDRTAPPFDDARLEQLAERVGIQAATEHVARYHAERELRIQQAKDDPLRAGFDLPHWEDALRLLEEKDELLVLGGNGSSKTEFGAKWIVQGLMKKPGSFALCVTTNEDLSRQKQQAAVYGYLPKELRALADGPKHRSRVANITYSQKGGFTENTFVLPNTSQCWFKTREQYERQPTSFEGPEYDRIHLDEPIPVGLLQTLRFRAAKRSGKILNTFTAIDGFDAVCHDVLTGSRVVRSLPMTYCWPGFECDVPVPELRMEDVQVKGCPPGHMPYILEPVNPKAGVICFWSHWNVFQPWRAVFDKCVGRPASQVRTRLFGWAESISGCQFPRFNPNIHVVDEARLPKEGTLYCACDPVLQGGRSFYILWAVVDPVGRVFIVDESPRMEEGEWATADGTAGDGTHIYGGRGVAWYRRYIREREQQLGYGKARHRWGDPKAFNTEVVAAEGGWNLMEMFCEHTTEEDEAMPWKPAKVSARILGAELDKINDFLAWNEGESLNVCNEPRLYVARRCRNLLRCMLRWEPAPAQPSNSPFKDPVDTLRYLFGQELHYLEPDGERTVGGGGW